MDLGRLNDLAPDEAREAFLGCCASTTWATQMVDRRPFAHPDHLLEVARVEWRSLGRNDREEAFAAHPRIGDSTAGAGRHADWSQREQAGTVGAGDELAERLAGCNREYELRFGRVYLVFATGKSAAEMLALCEERLGNDPETEYEIATTEQEKITDLRLRRLLEID